MNIEDVDDDTKEFIENVEKNISDFFLTKREEPRELLTGLALFSCIVEAKFQLTAKTMLDDKYEDLMEMRDDGVEQMKDNFNTNIAMGLMGRMMDSFDSRGDDEEDS